MNTRKSIPKARNYDDSPSIHKSYGNDDKWHWHVEGVGVFDYESDAVRAAEEYEEKNPAAVALGSIKSAKKAKSSAANGKLGGRPKKIK